MSADNIKRMQEEERADGPFTEADAKAKALRRWSAILFEEISNSTPASAGDVSGNTGLVEMNLRELAQSYLDREDEDWTFSDPEDIKRLARAVLSK